MSGAGPDGSFAVGSDGVSSPARARARSTSRRPTRRRTCCRRRSAPRRTAACSAPARTARTCAPWRHLEVRGRPRSRPQGLRLRPVRRAGAAQRRARRRRGGQRRAVGDKHGTPRCSTSSQTSSAVRAPARPTPTRSTRAATSCPTSLAQDRHGHIFVGGLVSEVPGAGPGRRAQPRRAGRAAGGQGVHVGHRRGRRPRRRDLRQPARGASRPTRTPQVRGVVTRIGPHGARTSVDVPFPAGAAVDTHDNVFVSAWSVARPRPACPGPGTVGSGVAPALLSPRRTGLLRWAGDHPRPGRGPGAGGRPGRRAGAPAARHRRRPGRGQVDAGRGARRAGRAARWSCRWTDSTCRPPCWPSAAGWPSGAARAPSTRPATSTCCAGCARANDVAAPAFDRAIEEPVPDAIAVPAAAAPS